MFYIAGLVFSIIVCRLPHLMTKGTLNYYRAFSLKWYFSLPFYVSSYRYNG